MFELRKLVKAVKGDLAAYQPALILHPRQDDRASLGNAHYLQWNLGGRVETVVLEDSYHVITLDRQRDVVLEKTLAFADLGAVARSRSARRCGSPGGRGLRQRYSSHLLLADQLCGASLAALRPLTVSGHGSVWRSPAFCRGVRRGSDNGNSGTP